MGSYMGVHLGFWTSYQVGLLQPNPVGEMPYPILWPTAAQYGHTLLRMVIGGLVIVVTKAIFRYDYV